MRLRFGQSIPLFGALRFRLRFRFRFRLRSGAASQPVPAPSGRGTLDFFLKTLARARAYLAHPLGERVSRLAS